MPLSAVMFQENAFTDVGISDGNCPVTEEAELCALLIAF